MVVACSIRERKNTASGGGAINAPAGVTTPDASTSPGETDAPESPVTESIQRLIREDAFRQKPRLDKSTEFGIREFAIEGLSESLGIRIFHADYLGPDGVPFNECIFIYHHGQAHPFACAFGGYGLMSGVVVDATLYYTYSWGSGIHRSHVGQLRVAGGQLVIHESEPFQFRDVFVRGSGGQVAVEVRRYKSFNSWDNAAGLGTVVLESKDGLYIVGLGKPIPPSSTEGVR
jgi:hypothetical protein